MPLHLQLETADPGDEEIEDSPDAHELESAADSDDQGEELLDWEKRLANLESKMDSGFATLGSQVAKIRRRKRKATPPSDPDPSESEIDPSPEVEQESLPKRDHRQPVTKEIRLPWQRAKS